MSNNLNFSNINLNSQDYFNSKLYFDLEKYKKQNKETIDFEEEIEQKLTFQNLNNDNFSLQECLSKDLLETIDSSPKEGKNKNIICPDTYTSEKSNDKSPLNDSLKKNDVNKEEKVIGIVLFVTI